MNEEVPQLDKEPSNQDKKKTSRFLNWRLLLIPVIAIPCFFALQSMRGKAAPVPAHAELYPVAVAKVIREDLAQEQTFEAEFRPYQEIDLHAKVAGFVQNINVDIGDRVNQGDILATLEIPELKQDLERASAMELRNEKEINRAAANYEDAHLSYTRLSSINETKPHLMAQQELDTALAHDRAAEAALAAARQEVEVSKAEVDKLKVMLDYCKITAPFSGVITRRYADEGSLIQGGVSPSATAMPLVRLSQNDRLRLDFPVSVSYVSRIKIGDPVDIRIQALGKSISGKVCRFTRKVNTDTRTMEAEVDVPNPDLSLTPGIYAVAGLKLDRREKVLTIPAEAISNHKAPTVFVLNKTNEIEERPVTLGLETADKLEVLTGLNENDLVLVGSRAQVKPGQKVEPKILEVGSL
ncbi:MAG: Efflux transporter, family, subunit [Pedosphaera sp.]|nr:Efflux transporter, family, subunit [Pedosphaera sp.]